MHKRSFRTDRVHAALLQRKAELTLQLAMKSETKPYAFAQVFAFHFQGTERSRMEQEEAFIGSLLAILAESTE